MPSHIRNARRLSWIIAALAALSSAAGLLQHGLYRDNALVAASWYGNDLVTLVVAVPLLAAALVRMRRGSARATLVWLGMLLYTLYNYAFYRPFGGHHLDRRRGPFEGLDAAFAVGTHRCGLSRGKRRTVAFPAPAVRVSSAAAAHRLPEGRAGSCCR